MCCRDVGVAEYVWVALNRAILPIGTLVWATVIRRHDTRRERERDVRRAQAHATAGTYIRHHLKDLVHIVRDEYWTADSNWRGKSRVVVEAAVWKDSFKRSGQCGDV